MYTVYRLHLASRQRMRVQVELVLVGVEQELVPEEPHLAQQHLGWECESEIACIASTARVKTTTTTAGWRLRALRRSVDSLMKQEQTFLTSLKYNKEFPLALNI